MSLVKSKSCTSGPVAVMCLTMVNCASLVLVYTHVIVSPGAGSTDISLSRGSKLAVPPIAIVDAPVPPVQVISVRSQPSVTVSSEVAAAPKLSDRVKISLSLKVPVKSPLKSKSAGSSAGIVCFSTINVPSFVLVTLQLITSPSCTLRVIVLPGISMSLSALIDSVH